MAKIGTAHIEIKPVLNEEALEAIVSRIEQAVEDGVSRALARHDKPVRVWRNGLASATSTTTAP